MICTDRLGQTADSLVQEPLVKHHFNVIGMTCGHCEKAISRALRELDSSAVVAIDRRIGQVLVDSDCERAALASAIVAEGYTVAPEPAPSPG
jgi:copper chaperone